MRLTEDRHRQRNAGGPAALHVAESRVEAGDARRALTTVVVRKVGGTPDQRWYFVETPEGERGWISDKM